MLAVVSGLCRDWDDLTPGMLSLQLIDSRQHQFGRPQQIDFVEQEPKTISPSGEVIKDTLVFLVPVPGVDNLADDVSTAPGTVGRLICHFTQ